MSARVPCRVSRRALDRTLRVITAAWGRPTPEPGMDLLLIAAFAAAGLVGVLTLVWVLPAALVAAVVALADDAAGAGAVRPRQV